MEFDRAHRLGPITNRNTRPIVVKFHHYTDRETIRVRSYDEDIKRKLNDARQGVGIQTPFQVREARKALFPLAKEEEQKGNRVRINGNKLLVNNIIKMKYVNGRVCCHEDVAIN